MFEKALFINPVFPLSRYDDNLSSKPKLSNIGAIALPATKLIAIDENQIAIVNFGFLINEFHKQCPSKELPIAFFVLLLL